MRSTRFHVRTLTGVTYLSLLIAAFNAHSQSGNIVWSDREKPVERQLHGLRELPDDVRAKTTRALALEIRSLPPSVNQVDLASWPTGLSTEGDFGHDTLQEVATTLSAAQNGKIAYAYTSLAQLVRYEHVHAVLNDPKFEKAMAQLEAEDSVRQRANFTLNDLEGKSWSLS